MQLTDKARMEIAEAGFDPEYGARPLRRVIQNRIQDPLSEALLANEFIAGDSIEIDYRGAASEDEAEDFIITVIDHQDIDEGDSETAEAVEVMLQ